MPRTRGISSSIIWALPSRWTETPMKRREFSLDRAVAMIDLWVCKNASVRFFVAHGQLVLRFFRKLHN